jgi:hypothetical protein
MTTFIFKTNKFTYLLKFGICVFYPSVEPISQHRTVLAGVGWVGPFAVVHYSFMSHYLANIEVGLGGRFGS